MAAFDQYCCTAAIINHGLPAQDPCTSSTRSRSAAEQVHRSSSGDSSRNASNFTPRVRITDLQLITTLCRESCSTPSTMMQNTGLILHLVQAVGAVFDQTGHLVKRGGLQSALGIAYHCSFQVLLWIGEQLSKQKQHQQRLYKPRSRKDLSQVCDQTETSTKQETKLGIFELRSQLGCYSTAWPAREKPGLLYGIL